MYEEKEIEEYGGRILIPTLTLTRARQIIRRVKPVYRFKNNIRYIKSFRNMFTVDFTNFAEPSNRRTDNLKIFCEIKTFHKDFHFYNFIRPTIIEILSQISEKYFDEVVAFEFIGELEDNDELKLMASKFGYRVGRVCLYSDQ